jgi:hypothetical protein
MFNGNCQIDKVEALFRLIGTALFYCCNAYTALN